MSEVKFEIGHVLFIDIVGYSKLLINEQSEQLDILRKIVRGTEQLHLAEAEGKLMRLPTGDGGALVFRNSLEAPVLCALEIDKVLKSHPKLRVRMGIHSGPVTAITDLNEQANVAGAGINVAQRVMDCGDAGHILLSKRVADDLEHYPQWRSLLHELGDCEVKHGARVNAVNLYSDDVGNPAVPEKLKAARAAAAAAGAAQRKRGAFRRTQMQPPSQQISTCPTCGGVLEETFGGELGCMSCLLDAGIGSEEEEAQDSTPGAFEGGARFGVYEIDCHPDGSLYELGRGAMGVTYRATDTSLQRKVALKIIKADIAERSADARERFIREARAAAAFRHEHIATIYQFGMRLETGQYFYAMELIEGETLEQRVRRAGPLDSRTTIGIAQQVTSALAAAEKHGLVHRDLKPANLMLINPDDPKVIGSDQAPSKRSKIRALRKSGIPVIKIIDFGLAKAFHTATDPKSLTHDRFVGTPAFASPEQFEHATLDARSDIYSLGETLWFALTGKPPFAGHTVSEIHNAQKSDVLPTEQLKAAHVPHRLRSLLGSMLAFEPASRPGTHELATRLRRSSHEARHVQRTRLALAASLIALAATAGWMVWKSEFIHHPVTNGTTNKSVAVLAFANLSDDKGSEYFSDGISEELLTVLQKIPGLHVAARTSAFSFKGKNATAQEIGQKLGVAHLVDGSVRKAGNIVRIAARLTRTDTGEQLWSENFTRDLKDVFAVETELAQTIVGQLSGQLTGVAANPEVKAAIRAQVQAAEKGGTKNVDAHQHYLQGRFYADLASEKGAGEALSHYQRAVELDPSFALAWAGLAQTHVWYSGHSSEIARAGFDDHLALAREAAARALAIEPNLPEALLARAKIQLDFDFDWNGAAETVRRALALAPADPELVTVAGTLALARGDTTRAIELYRQAVALDPVNPSARAWLAFILGVTGRLAEARAEYRRVVELIPAAPWSHAGLGLAFIVNGKFEEAAVAAQDDAAEGNRLLVVAMARWSQKRIPEADAALARLTEGFADTAAYQIADVYAYRGDKDRAFEWLERARRQRDGSLGFMRCDPFLANLHEDPRWDVFLRKMGLADDQLK
jgi:eukaryotic-like serine/threonine-protein kinase